MTKLRTPLNCKMCDTSFLPYQPSSVCCSPKCRNELYAVSRSHKKFEGKEEGVDYVVCKICGLHAACLSFHLTAHKTNTEEYRQKYNAPTASQKYLENASEIVKGEKNPGYQHGGRLSPFSEKFVNADKIDRKELFKQARINMKERHNDPTTIEYYIKRGMNEEDAKKALSARQSTFSLKECIKRYGEEEGRVKWQERQAKWLKSYKKTNYSKVSQDLFWSLVDVGNLDKQYLHFAQLDENKNLDLSGSNHEMRLNLEKTIMPDFLDSKNNKIIEFNGAYWHKFEEKAELDRERLQILESAGYKVLCVDEMDYYKNKTKVIQECLSFLKQ